MSAPTLDDVERLLRAYNGVTGPNFVFVYAAENVQTTARLLPFREATQPVGDAVGVSSNSSDSNATRIAALVRALRVLIERRRAGMAEALASTAEVSP